MSTTPKTRFDRTERDRRMVDRTDRGGRPPLGSRPGWPAPQPAAGQPGENVLSDNCDAQTVTTTVLNLTRRLRSAHEPVTGTSLNHTSTRPECQTRLLPRDLPGVSASHRMVASGH
jgi:hypothetical protein